MNYTKPEVAVLGDAVRVIQGPKPPTMAGDGSFIEVGVYETEE